MAAKVVNWFKQLSKLGKFGIIGTVAVSLLMVAGASADPPVITTQTKTDTSSIPYDTTFQEDDSLFTNETKVITPGVKGSEKTTYKVTYSGDKETKREVTKEEVVTPPVAQVSAKGTKQKTTEFVTEAIPFTRTSTNDSTMAKGTSKVSTVGVNGSKKVTYEVIKIKGKEVSRTVVSEQTVSQPISQVTSVGTKAAAKSTTYCANGSYVNSAGSTVCSPSSSSSGATARCGDGSYSYSQSRSGTCSHHGGVATWL